jgi:hypothetical protein
MGAAATMSTPKLKRVSGLDFWQNSPVTPISEVKNASEAAPPTEATSTDANLKLREVGGREGPEPTRYGDWELKGRCIDF